MTTFDRSIWLDGLLERLEAHLVAQRVYAADAVFVYLGDGGDLLENPPRETFLAIGVQSVTPEQELWDGAGLVVPQFNGLFTLTQYTRLWVDRTKVDARLIKDKSRGLAWSLRTLVKALQLWDARDATDGSPLAEPGRLAGPAHFNGKRTPFGWASVQSTWELKFRADLAPGG